MTPGFEHFEVLALALDHNLNTPVEQIAHPSGESQLPRLIGSGQTVTDTVNAAAYKNMKPRQLGFVL